MRILYLHGFASSPASRKAGFFAERLANEGVCLEIPKLDQDDFGRLTIGGQLHLLESLLASDRAILIGSSLGGYVAALYAARHPEIDRLVLLAPAFQLSELWRHELGPDRVATWQREGTLSVFHYAQNREMPLAYGFLEDASRFEPFPQFQQPALVFHGNQDSSVPVQYSTVFAEQHPNVRLLRLDSNHELTDSLDTIWLETRAFVMSRLAELQC